MIYHVFANRSNIGDWLSALGIQSLLGHPEVVELLCDEPFVDETISALQGVGAHDTVIIGGGGLFMDYFEPFWMQFAPLAPDLRFVIWGVGFCDLKREDSRLEAEFLSGIVSHAEHCSVRDELTRSYFPRLALASPVMCPSIVLAPSGPKRGGSVLHVANYDTVGAQAYEEMRVAVREFATSTGRRFNETNNLIKQGDRSELHATLSLYESAEVVVSSALHGCILGVAAGRPVLAVSGDRKIESFMQAAGLSEWVLDHHDAESLGRRLASIGRQADVSQLIKSQRRANERVAERVMEVIAGGDR